jgi:shikimate dehydrogenase
VTGAVEVAGSRVLLLGAGGAAQAVATALVEADAASLTVAARREEAARALAERLLRGFPGRDVRVGGWPADTAEATILFNATPLKEELPAEPRAGQQVVDLAYLPDGRETALVAAARAAGCPAVVDGLEVLVRQGAASFSGGQGCARSTMRAAARGAA